MGPSASSSTRHLEELLSRKDEQIKTLDARCSAYLTKISLLQTRLQRTLDTLDEVQNTRAGEALSLNTTIKHLKERVRRCTDIAESAEMERDDMRDAVLRLVEKVESSNDYSHWPHSQIHLSILSDPLAHPVAVDPTVTKDQETNVLSYATSIIEELRRERDAERVSHARTRAVAEARILDLEAKLSRREAELESCAAHVDLEEEQEQDLTFTPKTTNRNVQPITSQQIISMLDVTVARNKILELEIKALVQQLDQARLAGPSSTAPRETNTVSLVGIQDPQPSVPFENVANSGETQGQLHSRPSTQDDDRSILEDLENQIRDLGHKIDAFRDERRILLDDLSSRTTQLNPSTDAISNQSPRNMIHMNGIQERLTFLEREYGRLRRTENDLRDELDATREQSRLREEQLLDQINIIQADLQAPTPLAQAEPNGETGNVSDLLAEPSDGELSMELATPLLPISSISLHPNSPGAAMQVLSANDAAPGRGSSDMDPPSSLPQPPSPERPLAAPSFGTPPIDQAEGLRDGLVHLENELVDTQRELEAGQAALEHLEELIDELQS